MTVSYLVTGRRLMFFVGIFLNNALNEYDCSVTENLRADIYLQPPRNPIELGSEVKVFIAGL